MRRFVFLFASVANLLLADQIVKEAAVRLLKGSSSVAVLPFFALTYVENRGCAWGLFQGQVWPLAAFALVALAFLTWKRREIFPAGKMGFVTEAFLVAGILGNLIDRVARGFVVDLFDFHWGVHHFPCFNVADTLISVAAFLLVGASLFSQKNKNESVH